MTEPADDPGFQILYDVGPCLIVNKPAGLLTQAPLGIDSLELRVKRFIKRREGKTGEIYLGVPHRLDRPVSGVIAFARHVRAARKISEQFEGRTVQKTYWALVPGMLEAPEGTWIDHLQKIDGEPRTIVVGATHPEGKIAILHYRVIESLPPGTPGNEPCSLLEIKLETGRTHQIRVQCSSRGLPMLGDTLYGSQASFGPWSDDERARLISLHARRLQLKHPMTREPLDIVAPLPELWRDYGVKEE